MYSNPEINWKRKRKKIQAHKKKCTTVETNRGKIFPFGKLYMRALKRKWENFFILMLFDMFSIQCCLAIRIVTFTFFLSFIIEKLKFSTHSKKKKQIIKKSLIIFLWWDAETFSNILFTFNFGEKSSFFLCFFCFFPENIYKKNLIIFYLKGNASLVKKIKARINVLCKIMNTLASWI